MSDSALADRLRRITIERVGVAHRRHCYAIGAPGCRVRARWSLHVVFYGAPGYGIITEVCARHLRSTARRMVR